MPSGVVEDFASSVRDVYDRIYRANEVDLVFVTSGRPGGSRGYVHTWPGHPRLIFYVNPRDLAGSLEEYLAEVIARGHRGRRLLLEEVAGSAAFAGFMVLLATRLADKVSGAYTFVAWVVLASMFLYLLHAMGRRYRRAVAEAPYRRLVTALDPPSRVKFAALVRLLSNIVRYMPYVCSRRFRPLMIPALPGRVYYCGCRVDEGGKRVVVKLARRASRLKKLRVAF